MGTWECGPGLESLWLNPKAKWKELYCCLPAHLGLTLAKVKGAHPFIYFLFESIFENLVSEQFTDAQHFQAKGSPGELTPAAHSSEPHGPLCALRVFSHLVLTTCEVGVLV